MPAAPFIAAIAVGSGAATAIGTAIAGTIGLSVAATGVAASLAAGTISTVVATAIGSGVVSAGIAVASGAKASTVLKSAIIGGVASYVGASVAGEVTKSVATAAAGNSATASIAASLGKIAGSMAGGGVSSAVGSVLSGEGDPIERLIKGGLTAGLSAGVLEGVRATLSNVPGFDKYDTATGKTVKGDAPIAVQRAVTAGLAAGAMGKDADKAILNSLLSSGTDYLSRGIKDLSATLKTSYDNALKTGETLERNVNRQNEIVKDYNSTAEAIEAKRATLQADLDKHNEFKDKYENYDAAMRRDGYTASGDEYGNISYHKLVGAKQVLRNDGEGEYYATVPDGSIRDSDGNPTYKYDYAPSKDTFLAEANKYATKVNDAIPGYEAERAKVETKLTNLAGELDTLKAELPTLEQTLTQQKTELDTSVAEFQKQEELNAQLVAKTYNDTVTAKAEVEQALGAPITQEQLDAFVQTGDVAAAARDYIDIKTTDLAEAQAAALAEGYRFDPNDPEMAARFLGVKDEAATLAAVRSFADARATTVQEATDLYTQTYADIYGPDVDVPPPTEEDLLAFMPQVPTDVSSIPEDYQSVAEDVVKGRIQDKFSQDLGFEDYDDRSFAQESLGQERPDADYWGQFKGTSGVVGVEDSDIAPVQFGATDKAATFIPQAEENDFVPQDTYAASDYGPFLPDDPRSQVSQPTDNQFGFDTFGQFDLAESQPPADQFGFDQPSFAADDFSTPTDFDVGVAEAAETPEFGLDTAGVGDVTADIPGVQTAAVEPPTFGEPALPDTQLSTAPVGLMESDFGIASAPADTSAVSDMLNYGRDQGVQTAAFQPSNIMPDTDNVGDIGLRSLVTTQQGGTSGTADDAGIASLTDQNLTETVKPELEATTKGSATYSALTDQDPTKTIAGSILDDESDDVRGGIQSGALYSGAEDEFGASNTLTAKYLNEPTKGQETEDVGLTRSLGTGNDTYTYAEPRPTDEILRDTSTGADADKLDQFLSPLRTEKTTLPVSQQPARVTPTDLEKNMDEDFDWDAWDRAAEQYYDEYDAARNLANMGAREDVGGVETLRTPDGVDESFLDRLTPAERERYLAMQDPDYQNPLAELAPQDLGISQESMDSFNQNFNPEGGFGSQWQTVGTNRVMIDDEGGGLVFDPTTGETSTLTPEQVQALIANGTLNSAKSGYVAATGGTGNRPGGTARPAGGTGKSTGADKLANAITNKLMNPKALAALGGAALGAASKPKGIDPRGLRSIATGGGPRLTQTGAKGTGGKGTVRYFEKKAAGGSIDGYAKGGGLGYLKSAHDGMEDKINATIDNKRPAKLSGGEFVIPADVVSHLGNGNSEAGAKQLYDLMERVRKARTGNSAQGKQINPKKYLPK
jgi:hypothetical protein